MVLVYTVIARGTCVLVEWSDIKGNFGTVIRSLLPSLQQRSSSTTSLVSYMYDSQYVFHCYEVAAELPDIRFICLSHMSCGTRLAYRYLMAVAAAFREKYGTQEPYACLPLALTTSFTPTLVRLQNDFKHQDTMPRVIEDKIEQVQNVLIESLDAISTRKERINLLIEKTQELNHASSDFRRQTDTLAHRLKTKRLVLGAVIIIAVTSLLAFSVRR